MSYSELFMDGWKILSDRQTWENRQRKFYEMRHHGLRRRHKPFPQAADLHLKLIDQKVNQKKAFTMAQVLGQERLATFVCMRQGQLQAQTESAASFFDFELKHKSNFIRVLQTTVDTMWLRGRGVIKAIVDPFDDYRIIHEAIDPLYILMPDDVNGFEDAYQFTHVRQIPVQRFKQDRRWCEGNADTATLKRLGGGLDAADRLRTQRGRDFETIQEDKELREGYTHSNSSDTIIVWETYVRTMGGWTVYSYCPVAIDVDIRKPFGVPYKVNGRVSLPFFSFVAEVKDEGWYSPRGVAEKIADNEIYGCKVWNAKADSMTFLTTPQYTSEVGVQNPANYRVAPGEVLPPGVKPAIFGTPPVSFDQEIAFARSEAELASASPDMGIQKVNTATGQQKPRTAREVQAATGVSQIGMNNEFLTFKDDLSRLYAHDWGLMLQYKRKELAFFVADDLQTMPEVALHGDYMILAGGATDDWDKARRIQKAMQRYQMLLGKPNVNQDELLTGLLAADDARLVKKLLIPQQQKQASEAADENTVINDIAPGGNRPSFPVQVQPNQDHFVRAQVILAWLDAAGKMGTPVTPVEKQRLYQRLAQHVQMLKKINPQQYQQLEMKIKQMEKMPVRQINPPLVPPMSSQHSRMPRGRIPAMQPR